MSNKNKVKQYYCICCQLVLFGPPHGHTSYHSSQPNWFRCRTRLNNIRLFIRLFICPAKTILFTSVHPNQTQTRLYLNIILKDHGLLHSYYPNLGFRRSVTNPYHVYTTPISLVVFLLFNIVCIRNFTCTSNRYNH